MKTLVLANRKLTLWAKSVPSAGKAQRLEWREGRIVVVVTEKNHQFQQPSYPPPPTFLPSEALQEDLTTQGACATGQKNQDGKFFSGPTMHVILTSSVCLCVSVAVSVWVDICWKRTTERWKIKKSSILHSAITYTEAYDCPFIFFSYQKDL